MPQAAPNPRSAQPSVRGGQWALVGVLVASVAINYIDRSNLSIAAPLLKSELKLSPAQLGLLLSAFFWTYSCFQLVSGWLVDHVKVNWVMTAGFALWCGATAATSLATGFAVLFGARLLLGMGESVAYPCYSRILSDGMDERRRGVANAMIDAGSKLGPAAGMLIGGTLMGRFGWRPFFLVLGVGAFVWLPFWWRYRPRHETHVGLDPTQKPEMLEILGHRCVWATFVGHFSGNYFWYFLLTWLPYYLVHDRGFSMGGMGVVGAVPLLGSAAASLVAGGLSARALARGASLTRVRKTCTAGGLAFATVILFVPAIDDTRLAMGVLILASLGYGMFASSHWTITHTIAGPLAAGRWSGMQNFVANLSGVAAPWLSGWIIQETGSPFGAFALTAAVALLGSAAYLFGLPQVARATWKCETAAAAA